MSRHGIPYLMYHEIESPHRRVNQNHEGYLRYVVTENSFRDQLKVIADSGSVGRNVSDALRAKDTEKIVVITFDDGCETDLLMACTHIEGAFFRCNLLRCCRVY